MCDYCNNTGEWEMDNNEPIVDCLICGDGVSPPRGDLLKDTGKKTMVKSITIAARINVGIEVTAEKDKNGEVQILTVHNFLGVPTPEEIYESMSDDELIALDDAFDEA